MYIGIDLGGTTIQGGLVDAKGHIHFKLTHKTPKTGGVDAIVKSIDHLIDGLLARASTPIEALGIGIPGLVNYQRDAVITCKNLNWDHVDLVKRMKKRPFPLRLDNDANAATYAEFKFGSLRGVKNGLMLTLGTGIGGGVIINGQDYRGSHGLGFEVGHMVIGDNFYTCNCGKKGCFETFASATALVKYVEKALEEGQETSLKASTLSARAIVEASKTGDKLAGHAFERLIHYLALGIGNLINLLDPEIIALGGGLSGAGDDLLKPLKEQLASQLFVEDYTHSQLVLASMGNDAGIVGAAFVGMV